MSKKSKLFVRAIAVLLSVLLLMQIMPLGGVFVLAADIAEEVKQVPPQSYPLLPDEEKTPVAFLEELVELRTANTKHIRNADGSFVAAEYPLPIHYQDSNGDWQEIDNTLVDQGDYYVPKGSGLDVSLPKILDAENGITIADGDCSIALGISGSSDEAVRVIFKEDENLQLSAQGDTTLAEAEQTQLANEEFVSVENLSGTIIYPNAFAGTALEYTLESNKIKETLFVLKRQDTYIYDFTLDLEGLTARRQSDSSILLLDKYGAQRFEIEAPVACDANGVFSTTALKLSLEGSLLTLTADPAWMNAANRAYPIALDPTITVMNYREMDEITVSTDLSVLTNNFADGTFSVGKQTRTYFRFDLPKIPDSSVITNAQLFFVQYEKAGSGSFSVNAYAVDRDWISGATWSRQPLSNTANSCLEKEALDGVRANGYGSAGKSISWDITPAVKNWYENKEPNNGIMLASSDETSSGIARYYTSNSALLLWQSFKTMMDILNTLDAEPLYDEYSGIYIYPEINNDGRGFVPGVFIFYVSGVGLESYWSYEPIDMGEAGTAFINRYNGSLTYVHNDIATVGERMPVSVNHMYLNNLNSAPGTYWNMKLGQGVRLSAVEQLARISSVEPENRRIAITDGDGTLHYFVPVNPEATFWDDNMVYELDPSITLKYVANPSPGGPGWYELVDEMGNKKTYSYTDAGLEYRLTRIEDTNGNAQELTYNGGRLTEIKDSIGRKTTLSYNSSGYLIEISDPANRRTRFGYDESKNLLTSITNTEGKTALLRYEERKGNNSSLAAQTVLAGIEAPDGLSYMLDYETLQAKDGASYRVSGARLTKGVIKMVIIPGTSIPSDFIRWISRFFYALLGPFISWFVGKDPWDRWYFLKNGPPQTPGDRQEPRQTSEDISAVKLKYEFGQTTVTSIADAKSPQTDAYNTATNIYVFDYFGRVLSTTDVAGNSSFVSYNNDVGKANLPAYFASASMVRNLLTNPSFEAGGWNGSGLPITNDVYAGHNSWQLSSGQSQTQSVTLPTANVAYTLSVFAKSEDGAKGKLRYTFGTVTGELEMDPGAAWERFSITFTAERSLSGTISITMNGLGSLLIDAVQLEQNGGAGPYNQVENSYFSQKNGSAAALWTAPDNGGYKEQAFILNGIYTANYIKQTIPLNAKKDDIIVFGARVKMASAIFGMAEAQVVATFKRTNGTVIERVPLNFHKEIRSSAQIIGGSYALAEDCASVDLLISYSWQLNSMAILDTFLFIGGTGATVNYQKYGTISVGDKQKTLDRISSVSTNSGNVSYTYNENKDIKTVRVDLPDGSSQTAEYTYDDTFKRLVKTAIEKVDGVEVGRTDISYGTGGVVISVKNSDGGASTTQTLQYTHSNNDVSSFMDSSGLGGSYEYISAERNLITKSTATDKSEYQYSYTPQNFLRSVSSGSGKNEYQYTDKNQLESITRNGTEYSFAYNDLGQATETAIGGNTTKTNYNKYHQVSSVEHANGDSVSFVYDTLGRVVSENYSNVDTADTRNSYIYDNSGGISGIMSSETGQNTRFAFDISGRLTDIQTQATSGDSSRIRMSYDQRGALSQFKASNQSGILSQVNYTYDKRGRTEKTLLTSLNGGEVQYAYTTLSRLQSEKHILPGGSNVTASYSYKPNGTNTTGFVERMATALPGRTLTYDYTYRAGSSNIESISETGGRQNTYTYDTLGQLMKDAAPGRTMDYAYDSGSNITSIKENGTEIHSFKYSETGWRDQLVEFDGKVITYDKMGNPLTYGDDMEFTWQKGRELAGIKSPSLTTSYSYGYNGLRASKKVNGVTTKYTWAGTLLMSQSDGTNTINWSYNPAGRAIGFSLNGVPYFYLRNLQGDVTGIYDVNGSVVATYSYDAWGNILDIWQANGYTVGNVNPIRYRGYYWDAETGYYYCQSRYYSPEWCRWINADAFMDDGIIGTNLYVYCLNDPVNSTDPSGKATWWEKQGLTSANEIHNEVMKAYWKYYVTEGAYDAVWTNVYLTNITKNGKQGKTGYADLVLEDIKNQRAYFYEIKSVQSTQKEIAKGAKQLGEYLTGSWKDRGNYRFSRGTTAPGMVLNYSNEKYYYTIYTYYAGDGVIAYWYTKSKKRNYRGEELVRGLADGALIIGSYLTAYIFMQGLVEPEQVVRAVEKLIDIAA